MVVLFLERLIQAVRDIDSETDALLLSATWDG
jgi:hypothetical protein